MRNIAVLGSTGSIGTQTLDIVREKSYDLKISAMSCGRNIKLFEEQIREFRPKLVSVGSEDDAKDLREKIAEDYIEYKTAQFQVIIYD